MPAARRHPCLRREDVGRKRSFSRTGKRRAEDVASGGDPASWIGGMRLGSLMAAGWEPALRGVTNNETQHVTTITPQSSGRE
jgi:hypothetical protein